MQSKVCLGRHTVYTNRRSNSNRRLMPAWFRLAWNQVRIQFRADEGGPIYMEKDFSRWGGPNIYLDTRGPAGRANLARIFPRGFAVRGCGGSAPALILSSATGGEKILQHPFCFCTIDTVSILDYMRLKYIIWLHSVIVHYFMLYFALLYCITIC